MALSNAEHQRLFRQRRKKKLKTVADQSEAVVTKPFSEFVGDRTFMFDETLDSLGIRIMGRDFLTKEPQVFESEFVRQEPLSSLDRATGLVGAFLDAATELATLINEYKLGEIDRQLPVARGAKRLQLEQIRKRLAKRTSVFLPVIEVKGD